MIDIKTNIDTMWVYFPSNESEILNKLTELSPYQFYENYLLELSAREFQDFFQYLLDYKINNEITDEDSVSQLINYGFGQESTLNNDGTFTDFDFIRARVEDLRKKHLTEKINTEKKALGLKISQPISLIKKEKRL